LNYRLHRLGADLIILAGNVALESMGFVPLGFSGGRIDIPIDHRRDQNDVDDVNWGPEDVWLGDQRYSSSTDRTSLAHPLGAVQMGLIYVNPEGPNGIPDPLLAAHDIRETFARMGFHNDDETVALIAGGHTFGKCHGAANADTYVGPEPEAAPIEHQGLGWISSYKSGSGEHTITSGLEGAWTENPTRWDHGYFHNLFHFDWITSKSPAGAIQWIPSSSSSGTTPNVIMLTTDLALRFDPQYARISRRFYENPKEFACAFAKAWFKLTHRDMGPLSRYLGPETPPEVFVWQDPLPSPPNQRQLLSPRAIFQLKSKILSYGLPRSLWIQVAWASACTYRNTDHRGGANGSRIRFAPQNTWAVNKPIVLRKVLTALTEIRNAYLLEHQRDSSVHDVSIADLIVLGGCAAIEEAAGRGGCHNIQVPFIPGRTDASVEETDVESFHHLEPVSDGFRNYLDPKLNNRLPEELLVDQAHKLGLSASEMTALVGGLRALDITHESGMGVLTKTPGILDNSFFINLLDMHTVWKVAEHVGSTNSFSSANSGVANKFEGYTRDTNKLLWRASRVDLLFGSHSELRAHAETYACSDSGPYFIQDFVKAWNKVMNADRWDVTDYEHRQNIFRHSKL
jgi:catalase-peroxidase